MGIDVLGDACRGADDPSFLRLGHTIFCSGYRAVRDRAKAKSGASRLEELGSSHADGGAVLPGLPWRPQLGGATCSFRDLGAADGFRFDVDSSTRMVPRFGFAAWSVGV